MLNGAREVETENLRKKDHFCSSGRREIKFTFPERVIYVERPSLTMPWYSPSKHLASFLLSIYIIPRDYDYSFT